MAPPDSDPNESTTPEEKARALELLKEFEPREIINQDQGGRRVNILGQARGEPGILLVSRAALPAEINGVQRLHAGLVDLANLGANDIYAWYLARVAPDVDQADLKLDLVWPCRASHITKYSAQSGRIVTETPAIFKQYVRPYMHRMTQDGRQNWVYNIIEGRQEQQDIILRSSTALGHDPEGFLLLPDMNWDRSTMTSLRLLCLVERRDLLSLRDLRKRDVPWLKTLYGRIRDAAAAKYPGVEADMLKAYMHYQPTYYHFHIHVVSVLCEPNATQAVGKAFSLPNVISQLETMAGGPDAGMADVELTYGLGDKSDLWTQVFLPLKEGRAPTLPEVVREGE